MANLRKKKWQEAPEDIFLKIAYEEKIIKKITHSFDELNQEDKGNLKFIMMQMNMEDYLIYLQCRLFFQF